jgi:RNA polymerase sigma-70 factor (ECF subfamily)
MMVATRTSIVRDLFDQYFERVYRFIRRSTDEATADEIVQDVFLKLLQHPDLESKTLSVSYLFKIADNLLKRRFQRTRRASEIHQDLAGSSAPWAMTARDTSDDDAPGIAAALGRLKDGERDAVRMIVCEELSYEAAALSLGVRVTTVNNWKHRGLERLRESAAAGGSAVRAPDRRGTPGREAARLGGDRGRDAAA